MRGNKVGKTFPPDSRALLRPLPLLLVLDQEALSSHSFWSLAAVSTYMLISSPVEPVIHGHWKPCPMWYQRKGSMTNKNLKMQKVLALKR